MDTLGQDALGQKDVRVDNGAVLKVVESRDVDGLERFGKDVVEAALRDAARQRHLAAFEADAELAAAAGFLALVTTTGSLAVAGGGATAFALIDMGRTHDRSKFVQIHLLVLLIVLP